MDNTAAATEDQSMEEILQSIRRIIAEEGEENVTPQASGSDVLELTDVVTDEGAVVNIQSEPAEETPATVNTNEVDFDAIATSEEHEAPAGNDDVLQNIDTLIGVPETSQPTASAMDPLSAIDSLLSNEAAAATSSAFKSIKRPSHTEVLPAVDSLAFRSGTTVEDLMMESLRPMLKTWLDTNLPGIVERIVEREVKKLAQ